MASYRPHAIDPQLLAACDQLITAAGGNPDSVRAAWVREMLLSNLKLLGDGADTGELKLLSRSFKELRYGLKIFRQYRDVPKVSIFGSARTPEAHPDYQAAEAFSRALFEAGWMIITGAGNGIMRAGHGGAGREASFGVSIRLPFETNANEFIVGDPKLITFRYFFTRKVMFLWQSHAVALFPGGFGTHDEGFEVLTLIQTGKTRMIPVVMVDRPGGSYWREWDRYVHGHLLANRMISPEDLNLYFVTDDPQQAAQHVLHFYRNFHSERFVGDFLVLRMQRPLPAAALASLNHEFADLLVDGCIEQGEPFPEEDDHLHLPRLKFHFARRSYGRLRLLIDRINALAV